MSICREEIQPGTHIQNDTQIDTFVRESVESAYHPSCSCKMGTDELSVVDSETKVHGIQGLRVVNSSIFPTIPNSNLNAPTMMLAERAADIIKGHTLPPESVTVTLDAQRQGQQRANLAKR